MTALSAASTPAWADGITRQIPSGGTTSIKLVPTGSGAIEFPEFIGQPRAEGAGADAGAGAAAVNRSLTTGTGQGAPATRAATGGGGWHHWFSPSGLGNRPPRGLAHVDWRGRGGCVLAPPSRHISGRTYRWVRSLDQAPLPEVPAAMRARLDPDPPTPAQPARTAGSNVAGHPYGRRVLAAELPALGRATPGHRNRTLNRTAFKVYRYVAGGVLPDDEVAAAFTEIARAIGLSAAETSRTLASARTAGLANPRTVPAASGARIGEDGS